MKRFYTTKSPNNTRGKFLLNTLEEALIDAKTKVAAERETRYVVEILYKVEIAEPPVQVTRIQNEEE